MRYLLGSLKILDMYVSFILELYSVYLTDF